MVVESVGEEDACAEMKRPAPEFCEQLAFHPDVLDIFRVLRRRNGWDFLVEGDFDCFAFVRIDPHFFGCAEQVAGRAVPALAFSAVHGQLDGVAIGPMECLVPVEQGLHPVFAGRDFGDALQGVSEDGPVDDCFVAGFQAVDVDAEDELRSRAVVDLEPRFSASVGGNHEEHAAVECFLAQVFPEGDCELKMAVCLLICFLTMKQENGNDNCC